MQVASEAAIITGVEAGASAESQDRRARFEVIYRSHVRVVLGFALRRVDRPEDAADVLSEVMLVAWRRLDDVPPDGEARLWLYGVARRVLANQARSASRRTQLGQRLRDDLHTLAGARQDFAGQYELRDQVRTALAELAESDRELLLLSSWEGLTPTEIAKVLGTRAGGVRTRLHRARRRLRARLELAEPTKEES